MAAAGDFYEDDEPLEDVLNAYDTGEKGVTAPPSAVAHAELGSRTLFFGWPVDQGREPTLVPLGRTEHAPSR